MGNLLKSFGQLLVSVLISIFIFIPILIVKLGWNELRRVLVNIYFKKTGHLVEISNGSEGCHLSSWDIIRVLCVFKGKADFEKLKHLFIKKILQAQDSYGEFKYKKLRSNFIIKAGYSCWEMDTKFETSNHFRTMPENAAWNEDEFLRFIQDLEKHLEPDRPRWKVIFLPTLPNSNESGLLLVMHHSYGDGLSIINTIAEQLSPETPFPYVINPVTFKPPFWPKLLLMVKAYAFFSWTLFNGIFNPPKTSKDRHKAECDGRIFHSTRFTVSLTQLKTIQKKTNGSKFSAILLTAAQNALDKINKERLWLNPMVLIAKLPYPKGKFCKRVLAMNVAIPEAKTGGDEASNIVAQLQEVSENSELSSNTTGIVNAKMARLTGRLPAQSNFTFQNLLVVSNLPFTTRPFDLGGHIITDCFVWPTLPRSIIVSSLSVGDKVNVAIGAGANILSKNELTLFVEEMKNQFNLLEMYNKCTELAWV